MPHPPISIPKRVDKNQLGMNNRHRPYNLFKLPCDCRGIIHGAGPFQDSPSTSEYELGRKWKLPLAKILGKETRTSAEMILNG
jgi:hypothetical protein